MPSYIIGFTVYNYYECVCAFVTYNKDYLLTYLTPPVTVIVFDFP